MSDEAQNLDISAVTAYVRERMDGFGDVTNVVKFETGQSNPTYLLETSTKNVVLRRKPMGELLKSAHAVDREFRVQSALAGSNVPVAKMHLLSDDDNVIGSQFYIMDHVDGRTFDDPRLPDLAIEERKPVLSEMCRVLAALHDVNIDEVGLSEYGPSGNYYVRQISRWSKQYLASRTEAYEPMDQLMAALDKQMPDEDGLRTLVHGDYRIDNMIFDKNSEKCLAVLDWEISTLGHPYADLAGVIMQWQMPTGKTGRGLQGVDRAENGLMSDQEFIDLYCAYRGLKRIENFGFYLGFCFFRMAAVLEGVKRRALDGNASNPKKALELGAHVPAFVSGGLKALGHD
ncbi:MAG: phosphotransferase family protein [Hyphomicrobiales bacterium]